MPRRNPYRPSKDKEMRIVMVGRTGNGKSATGNTILGQDCFKSKFSAKSMTVDCSAGKAVVDGQKVSVIDTPGLFDTRFGVERTTKDVTQCISYSAPGPHIFLVVIRLGRFTDEEKQTVQMIQNIFGEAADRYSMVLFTHGDLLEDTIEEYLGESPDLQGLVDRCNKQYHVFNNKLKDRKPQVTELLNKIRQIVQKNGGSHYTNEMFQDAERAIEEEKQRILKEKEEKKHKKRVEMEKQAQKHLQEELRKIQRKREAEKARERREREEERRREMERIEREREREREEREAQRRREEEERQRQIENMMRRLEEQRKRELEEERERLRRRAQRQAEEDDDCTIL